MQTNVSFYTKLTNLPRGMEFLEKKIFKLSKFLIENVVCSLNSRGTLHSLQLL